MNARISVGLIGFGAVARRPIVKRLTGVLGPVKASSFRLASRLVRSLHAGFPVRDYSGLQGCRTVLILAPDPKLPAIVQELALEGPRWRGVTFLLCDSVLESTVLLPLTEWGAAVGSVLELPGFEGERFLVEGDRRAIRAAYRLLGGRRPVIEVRPGAKVRVLAAAAMASDLLVPLAAAAQECLRAAGLRGVRATALVERMFARSLRGFIKSGRQSWRGPVATGDAAELERRVEALRAVDPRLAAYFRDLAALARRFFRGEIRSLE